MSKRNVSSNRVDGLSANSNLVSEYLKMVAYRKETAAYLNSRRDAYFAGIAAQDAKILKAKKQRQSKVRGAVRS